MKIKGLLAVGLAATATASFGQIVNGDFEAGNTGFSSDYLYSPGNGVPEQVYDVTTDPHLDHPAWDSFSAYSGTEMLVVNGGTDPTARFWYESVTLDADSTYALSYYDISQYSGSPADLQTSVGGTTLTANQLDGSANWENFTQSFTTTSAGSYLISMVDLNPQPSGNDFSIDDITLTKTASAVPGPAAAIPAILTGLVAVVRRRKLV
jgi:hypothetical protein